ncbi:MAG: hypothetical protein JJE30_12925 [Desulfuromonadales bacterium]|nr:hypothetical protein [Desulfuromonadales bacterium]
MAKTTRINYKAADGNDWTATIQHIDITRVFGNRLKTSDPKWFIALATGGQRQEVDKITYISKDGSVWSGRVRAHTERSKNFANYDFLLWPEEEHRVGQHVSDSMVFQTWDGTYQEIVRVYEQGEEVFLDVEPYCG